MNLDKICEKTIRIGFYLLFILVPLILTPWNYELFEYNKMMMTYALTGMIVIAWIIRMISQKEFRIAKTPLDIPIALFLGSQILATLFSMDAHISWFGYYSRFNGGLISTISYILLYYAFVTNFSRTQIFNSQSVGWGEKTYQHDGNENKQQNNHSIFNLLRVALATAGVVSLYGIFEHFGIDKNIWVQDVQSRVFSTLGQPNWLAAYLVALIPITFAAGLREFSIFNFQFSIKSQLHNVQTNKIHFIKGLLWTGLASVFFLTLLYTRSRSGLLAFAVVDILFWGYLFLHDLETHHGEHDTTPGKFFNDARQTPYFVPFALIHTVFFILFFFNGSHIDQIDKWITYPGWKSQITQHQIQTVATESASEEKTVVADTSVDEKQATGPVLETGGTESGTIRKFVWQAAIIAWKSSVKTILFGTGTETFAFAFYQFKPTGHNLTSEWDFLYNKAHNEYLNYLATTGILGLGTYLLFIGAFIFRCIKFTIHNSQFSNTIQYKKNNYSNIDALTPDTLTLGIFFGWLSILITNFFGFSVVIMQIFLFLFPAMMIVISNKRQETSNANNNLLCMTFALPEKKTKTLQLCFFLSLILYLILLSVLWIADKQYALGYHLSRGGQPTAGYQYLTSAVRLNPLEPVYHDERATIVSTIASALEESDATLSAELIPVAIEESDTALSISPNNVNFWKSRTKLLFAFSTFDDSYLPQAIAALEKAQVLAPADPKITYNLSILYGRMGQMDKGIEILQKTIVLKPNYRDAYNALAVFYNETGRSDLAVTVLTKYLKTIDPNDSEFKTMIGQ